MERSAYDALLRKHADEMVLRRPSTGSTSPVTYTDVTVYGKAFGSGASDIVGAVTQTTRRVKIGNAEIEAASWPGPPRNNDKLVLDGKTYTVLDCDTRADAGVTWQHVLTIKG